MYGRLGGTAAAIVLGLLAAAPGAQGAVPIGPLSSAAGCAALSPGGTRAAHLGASTTSTTTSTATTSATATTTTVLTATAAQAVGSSTTTSSSASSSSPAGTPTAGAPGPSGPCGGASGLAYPTEVAISPDGTSIYVIGGNATPPGYGVLDILHRDPATGDLTEVACLSSDGTDSHTGASEACLPTPGLLGGGAVAVSPDGATVYTGSSASAAILAFRRDPATGLLTRLGCLRLTPPLNSGCNAANVFGGIDALAVSPDGQGLYSGSGVGGPTPGSTTALSILTTGLVSTSTTSSASSSPTATVTTTTASTTSTGSATSTATTTATSTSTATPSVASVFGALAPATALANPCLATGEVDGACANATSTMGISSLAFSADGRFLYATASSSDAVDVFARSASGLLTQTGCLMAAPPPGPCSASALVSVPTDIAISPDGRSAYVVDSGRLVTATRTPASGTLDEGSCIDNGASTSSDNSSSDTTSTDTTSTDTTSTDTATGASIGTARAADAPPSCATAPGVSVVSAVAVSPDGASVYVTNSDQGGLVAFTRDPSSGALTESSCAASSDYLSNNSSSPCVKSPNGSGSRVVVSPDGRNVYALDPQGQALYGFGPAAAPAATSARVASDGRVAVRVACPRAARALCAGRLQLASLTRGRRRHAAHHASVAAASSSGGFRIAPGRSAVVRVRLARALVRRLASRHARAVRVLAETRPFPGGGGAAARVLVLH